MYTKMEINDFYLELSKLSYSGEKTKDLKLYIKKPFRIKLTGHPLSIVAILKEMNDHITASKMARHLTVCTKETIVSLPLFEDASYHNENGKADFPFIKFYEDIAFRCILLGNLSNKYDLDIEYNTLNNSLEPISTERYLFGEAHIKGPLSPERGCQKEELIDYFSFYKDRKNAKYSTENANCTNENCSRCDNSCCPGIDDDFDEEILDVHCEFCGAYIALNKALIENDTSECPWCHKPIKIS